MQIRVLFFGALKDVTGCAAQSVELAADADIGALYKQLEGQHPGLKRHRASLMFSRNREFADDSARLADGDEVGLLPPVSGGMDNPGSLAPDQAASRSIVRIVRAPIDVRALEAELARPTDGAVITFAGIVRNNSKMTQPDGSKVERETLYLEYEGYEPMALVKMREICETLVAEHPIGRIGMVHRLGRLEIGEASVVIVVASPHRPAAFTACRAAIDQLKKIVPIWKKEYFGDGAVWVEGEHSAPVR
jgi:molybdopterin synthase catalytic subunit/molybdopterin converting factor small subunit